MKGIAFTEFLDMIDNHHGVETVDRMITDAGVSGAYTSIGTYDHTELLAMVQSLSETIHTPAQDLVSAYGRHMLGRFAELYPHFFEEAGCTFDFLERLESYIHPEVRKLYPDAELPAFDHQRDAGRFTLTYRSARPLADFAHGLIEATAAYYNESFTIERVDHTDEPSIYSATFILTVS